MVTLQSVQSHTGLTHHFYFFLTFGHSGAQCKNLAPLGLKGLTQHREGQITPTHYSRPIRLLHPNTTQSLALTLVY